MEDLSKETLVILSIEKLEVDLRALSQLSPWFLHFPIPFFPILPIIPPQFPFPPCCFLVPMASAKVSGVGVSVDIRKGF